MAADCTLTRYKIVLVGDPGVGKTSYFLRIRNGDFVDPTQLSFSIDTHDLEYEYKIDDTHIKVWLQDTVGGERFRTRALPNCYRNADAVMLMFSVEDRYTFENLQEWYEDVREHIPDPDKFLWAVVGNKMDLPLEIEHETMEYKCKEIGTNLLYFTSAKTGEGVKEALEDLIKAVHESKLGTPRDNTLISLDAGPPVNGELQTSKKCCKNR